MNRKPFLSADEARERIKLRIDLEIAVDRFVRGESTDQYVAALEIVQGQLKWSAKVDADLEQATKDRELKGGAS